jgi:drug/metabolite transporter (DMT)-like permease
MRPGDAVRLTLLASIWGSSYMFIKIALDDLSPIQVVAARLTLGALVLLGVAVVTRLSVAPVRGELVPLVFLALVANILPFLAISWGEQRISSSLAAIVNSTTPLFTALIAAWLVPGERLARLRVAGIVLGFAGVVVIVGGAGGAHGLAGVAAIVFASLSYATGFVFTRLRLTNRGHSVVLLSTAQLAIASLLLAPVAAWDTAAHPTSPGPAAVLAVLVLGALGTGVAYLFYYRLIGDVGPTTASFVTYLVPVFGVLLGRIVLDERLGWNVLAGAALVVAGIAAAERAAPRRRAAAVVGEPHPGGTSATTSS